MDSLVVLVSLLCLSGTFKVSRALLLKLELVSPRWWFGSSALGSFLFGSSEIVAAMLLVTQFILNIDLGYWFIVLGIILIITMLYGTTREKTACLNARRKP